MTTRLPNLIGIWGLLYQSPGHEDGYGDIHFHGIKVVVHLLKINTLALIIDMAQLIISAPRPGMKLLPPPIQEREYTPRTKRARSGQSRATEGACGWQPQPRQLTGEWSALGLPLPENSGLLPVVFAILCCVTSYPRTQRLKENVSVSDVSFWGSGNREQLGWVFQT